MMRETFEYDLPKELIAQYPLREREKARMMVLHRGESGFSYSPSPGTYHPHLNPPPSRGRKRADEGEGRKGVWIDEDIFSNIENYFRLGDILVLNDTSVIPARLKGVKDTGGRVEIFLLKKTGPYRWDVLLRGNIREGQRCRVEKDGKFIAVEITGKKKTGSYTAEFSTEDDAEILSFGETPLPPYIKRNPTEEDRDFYQTVYARKEGAVAAPTAGLHFTEGILKRIEDKGVRIVYVTLHIGWASFKILRGDKNKVGEEYMEVSEETANVINSAKQSGGKVFACGTSVVRTLESAVERGNVIAKSGYTDLFIKEGFVFHVVDALITNFHLPGSTHLYLLCAFAGIDLAEKAYRIAVEKRYRFYSYGDAMLIIP